MSTLNPRDPYVSQDLGETFLKLQRLPLLKRVQVFNKLRQQAHSEASHRTAGFVANLMLVEAPVGIARSLPPRTNPKGLDDESRAAESHTLNA